MSTGETAEIDDHLPENTYHVKCRTESGTQVFVVLLVFGSLHHFMTEVRNEVEMQKVGRRYNDERA